ncbi:hypothetical protein OUZ56_011336 [Daphnia magna]|uniref:Uncharacterized protein n=1 Tax=Daphnia magna TaxID=35525 RepID=A0ABQ9YZU9_9CRUS|nr:hypothetical protein OUZ56_011336 [Daphnia magna]
MLKSFPNEYVALLGDLDPTLREVNYTKIRLCELEFKNSYFLIQLEVLIFWPLKMVGPGTFKKYRGIGSGRKSNFSKFSSERLALVGMKMRPPALNKRSTEADDGRAALYFMYSFSK